MKVSVIIPVYNERALILEIVRRALAAELPDGVEREVLVIDDGSDDGTGRLLASAGFPATVRVYTSVLNHGKGAAVRTGFKIATGDVLLIQDGDLEYDPLENLYKLVEPFLDDSVDVVYGSRFLETTFPDGMAPQYWLANQILTLTTRALYRAPITDEATGYKVFRRRVIERLSLSSNGFEICPELTGKILRRGTRIVEVPVAYRGRNLLQGKKIRARHGFIAMFTLVRGRLVGTREP